MRTSLETVVETLGVETDSQRAVLLHTCCYGRTAVCVMLNLPYDPVILHSVEFLLQSLLEVNAALAGASIDGLASRFRNRLALPSKLPMRSI